MDGFGWVIWEREREREKTQREGDRERQRGDREKEREGVRETFGPSVDSPDTYASQQLTPTIKVSHL